MLTLFVIGHLVGNLKVYGAQENLNDYAAFLKELGPLLWIARAGLLAIFVIHIALAISLKRRSALARPIGYAHTSTVQASIGSRTMLTTGLVVGAFVLFHLAHYTFGWIKGTEMTIPQTASLTPSIAEEVALRGFDAGQPVTVNYLDLRDSRGKHDVHTMVISGFSHPVISGLYILAMLFFFLHLKHGVGSSMQTLGLNSRRWNRLWTLAAWSIALFVVGGNISIPVAVLLGVLKSTPDVPLTLEAWLS